MITQRLLKENVGVIFLFLVLICSLSGNVLLLRKYESVIRRPLLELGMSAGFHLQSFAILDKNGKVSQLEFSGTKRTVLYVLSPTCTWCRRNEANITSLMNMKEAEYNFVGLSITNDNLREFWRSTKLPIPVYYVLSAKVLSDYHFSDETPQMAVVDNTGKVEQVWRGALDGQNLSGVEAYFGVELPGLTKLSSPEVSSLSAK